MGIYLQPPGPYTGPASGTQPYGQRKLVSSLLSSTPDNPPLRSNAALLALLVTAWQPNAYPSQRPAQIAALLPAVVEQPAFSRASLPIIVQSWQALASPSQLSEQKLFPSLLSVTPDDPQPRSNAALLAQLLTAWQPTPSPRQPVEGIAALLPVIAEQPAFSRASWPLIVQAWQPLPYPSQGQEKLFPSLLSVTPDDPPGRSNAAILSQFVTAWQAIPNPRQPIEGIAALLPVAVEQVPFSWPSLPLIVRSWQAVGYPTAGQQKLFPSALSSTPDSPPGRSNAELLARLFTTWQAIPNPDQRSARIAALLPAAVVALLFTEDLRVFFQFADFALEASWTPSAGGAPQTAQVLLDAPDLELLDGSVQSLEYAITYAVTQLTGLKTGETLSVDGVSYTVREVTAQDDGAVLRATLTKP